MKTTTSTVTPISENPKQPQPRQTAKEVIAANVKSLIEQLEAGHSDALTAYLDAMSRFHSRLYGQVTRCAFMRTDPSLAALQSRSHLIYFGPFPPEMRIHFFPT